MTNSINMGVPWASRRFSLLCEHTEMGQAEILVAFCLIAGNIANGKCLRKMWKGFARPSYEPQMVNLKNLSNYRQCYPADVVECLDGRGV